MTVSADDALPRGAGETRVIAAIGTAHFVSHYYILVLPPLFAFVRADYGVSYTELGFALAAFNGISALLQTPAGFLVDRLGPRIPLIAGLLCGAAAFAVAGLVHSFWVLVAMFALAGLGNTVYHPADYAILSHRIAAERIGRAYSIHTFAGMLGSTLAPGSLLLMQGLWGWRGAFLGAAALGLLVALLLMLQGADAQEHAAPTKAATGAHGAPSGLRLLMSPPILLNLAFFVLLALISGGMQNYSVVALGATHGTPPATANAALSAYLLFSALGVLAGGLLVTRTTRHGLVAALGLLATTAVAALVGLVDLDAVTLIAAMGFGGLFNGIVMPSRDMIVRAVTPPGSFGKVFGFVTNGFNIGGIVAPLVFGPLLDHGTPHFVFLLTAAAGLFAIATVFGSAPRQGQE